MYEYVYIYIFLITNTYLDLGRPFCSKSPKLRSRTMAGVECLLFVTPGDVEKSGVVSTCPIITWNVFYSRYYIVTKLHDRSESSGFPI